MRHFAGRGAGNGGACRLNPTGSEVIKSGSGPRRGPPATLRGAAPVRRHTLKVSLIKFTRHFSLLRHKATKSMRTRAPWLLLLAAVAVGTLGTSFLGAPALAQGQTAPQQKLVEEVQVEGNRRMSDEG